MGQVNQPDDLLARIDRLERQLAEVRKRSGIGNAVSRGTFSFVDTGGGTRVYFGPVSPGGATGFIFTRQDGTNALTMEGTPGLQFVALRDRSSNIIVSDDTNSGVGLATPYIPYVATANSNLVNPTESTTSATFVEKWRIHGPKQHPKIAVQVLAQTAAGTTAEIQLAEAASTVLALQAIPAADNNYYTLVGSPGGSFQQPMFIRCEARVVSGPGDIRFAVAYAVGRQS
jgi:hypothetical protein